MGADLRANSLRLGELVAGVRAAVQMRAGWRKTARLVAAELERQHGP
jgi:hypothetical protein